VSQNQILVVEDEPDIAGLITYLLRREGYEVLLAQDGSVALKLLLSTIPDLVMTDVTMPVMDGCDLLERLRSDSRLNSIPVFVLSSLSELAVREKCEDMDAFLQKPFKAEDLLQVVGTLLARSSQIRASR
jgi:CheY-like chemotaxis protein